MMISYQKKLCEYCFSHMSSERCESCGFSGKEYFPDPTILPVGTMLRNRYQIGGIIGKGGFGITYFGFDTNLERRIAIKEYFPYGMAMRNTENMTVMVTESEDVFRNGAEKFSDEARLIAKFNNSENIVNVYDVFAENNTVYYVMEYLMGQTLKSYVENSSRLTSCQAVYIAGQIAEALNITHRMNVLHRDISPDNIMLCSDGKVKLIDFGAARQIVSEGSQSMSVILTQGFAPLEQYQKKGKQGPWTDIYSLGASLYYGMTGEILDDPMSRFEDDSEFQANPHAIDSELWMIITKAVMIKIADRYQNVSELKDALSALSVRPEKIIISDEAAKIKVSTGTKSHSSVAKSNNANSSMSGASSMQTMPVGQSSQMQTMPVSQSSQMRTMPVNEAQHPKTGNYENNDTPKKKNRIPVIAGAASGLILLIAIIAIAVNGGSSDDIAIEESVTVTTSVSESEKITEKEPETEKEEEIIVQPDNSEKASQEPSPKPSENAAQPEKPEKASQEPSAKPSESTAQPEKPEKASQEPSAKPSESTAQPEKPEKASQESSPKPSENAAQPEKPEKASQEPSPKPAETTPKPAETAAPKTTWKTVSSDALKLSYKIPSGYSLDDDSHDEWRYYRNTEAKAEIDLYFFNNFNFHPIFSYKDMPKFIDKYMDEYYNGTISGGKGKYTTFAGRNAWVYEFYQDFKDNTYYGMEIFCDSKTKCGCYSFSVTYLVGDSASEAILEEFLDSIKITGTPEAFRTKGMNAHRGDRGANALGITADVGFFYNAPGYKFTGKDGETLYIGDMLDNSIDITVTPRSLKEYCKYYNIDTKDLEKVTYGDNTFYFYEKYIEGSNEKIHICYYFMKSGSYTLDVSTWNADATLTKTLKEDILPSIYIYEQGAYP